MKLSAVLLLCLLAVVAVSAVDKKHHHHTKNHHHNKHHKKKWGFLRSAVDSLFGSSDKESKEATETPEATVDAVEDVIEDKVEKLEETIETPEEAVKDDNSDPCGHAKTAKGIWIRREWRDMRPEDQKTFLKAVNQLKTAGEWDKYPLMHWKLDRQIHGVSIFYPWHRRFLANLENELRAQGPEYQCLTLPFWDWTQDSEDPYSSKVFDTEFGFGSLKAGCVDDGPFAGWTAAKASGGKTCLHRNPGGSSCGGWPEALPTTATLKQFVLSDSFENFWGNTEGYPHGGPHCFVGGTMSAMSSPDDPIFFLHHAFIDKLFSDWQKCHGYDVSAKKMKGQWKKAFPWKGKRTQRMPMHPSLDSSNVEGVWNHKARLNYVYKDDEFEQRSAFQSMCDQMYGRTDDQRVGEAAEDAVASLIETSVNKTSAEFDPKAMWKKVSVLVKSSIVFMGKMQEGASVPEAMADAARYECENQNADTKSDAVSSEWVERNGLTKLCDAGYCANPCKQFAGKADPAPGSVAAKDINKAPDAADLDDDKAVDPTEIETDLYGLKPDQEEGTK